MFYNSLDPFNLIPYPPRRDQGPFLRLTARPCSSFSIVSRAPDIAFSCWSPPPPVSSLKSPPAVEDMTTLPASGVPVLDASRDAKKESNRNCQNESRFSSPRIPFFSSYEERSFLSSVSVFFKELARGVPCRLDFFF